MTFLDFMLPLIIVKAFQQRQMFIDFKIEGTKVSLIKSCVNLNVGIICTQ